MEMREVLVIIRTGSKLAEDSHISIAVGMRVVEEGIGMLYLRQIGDNDFYKIEASYTHQISKRSANVIDALEIHQLFTGKRDFHTGSWSTKLANSSCAERVNPSEEIRKMVDQIYHKWFEWFAC